MSSTVGIIKSIFYKKVSLTFEPYFTIVLDCLRSSLKV